MKEIYESWLRRTNNITEDCNLCKNQRYYFEFNEHRKKPTIHACPSCNWNDLQITKETDFLPLHKFVMVKSNKLDINNL